MQMLPGGWEIRDQGGQRGDENEEAAAAGEAMTIRIVPNHRLRAEESNSESILLEDENGII